MTKYYIPVSQPGEKIRHVECKPSYPPDRVIDDFGRIHLVGHDAFHCYYNAALESIHRLKLRLAVLEDEAVCVRSSINKFELEVAHLNTEPFWTPSDPSSQPSK